MWTLWVRVCVRAWVSVLYVCFSLTVYPHPFYVCGATRFISTCLQNYRSMPVLDLWNLIDAQSQCNFSSVQQLSNDTSASVNLREVCVWLCVRVSVRAHVHILVQKCDFEAAWHILKKKKTTTTCMYVTCEPPTPQWVWFFFHLKDNHMYSFLSFFCPLWFLVICKFVQKRNKNKLCWYLCTAYNHAIQHYNRIVSCK